MPWQVARSVRPRSRKGAECAKTAARELKGFSAAGHRYDLSMYEVDPDWTLRCHEPGCEQAWQAQQPPRGKLPVFRWDDGLYKCPVYGCSYAAETARCVYRHYAATAKMKAPSRPHPGKACAASPKNLLPAKRLAKFRQHVKWHSTQKFMQKR